ncbi:X-Pro dipeptidyl-peptidase [Mucilaginibacter sp. PPCGB 2223]|uniref:CocE/NonD family hydrolase n=1 Tax=Mucilaginibacter sp. PPCGB 2223 TaxID=1886027 RepID=UPI000824DB58|nr:CocE/NonD family hydrolase [Mucilaginibacter sp. PPCGB 2223]OCX51976.1 X-Pro dipeptidyl-peptidase [Mucilaginibacter sp. PPCGB 2223]
MKKLFVFILGLATTGAFAQGFTAPDAQYIKDNYTKTEYQIPMRDGKKLFTSVYVPKDQSKKYPFMMDRTCYSVAPYGAGYKSALGPSSAFVHDGYIFVYQDVRGRWMSEGIYEEMTPELEDHSSPKKIDEGTDTYDTIDWLLKNIPNNNGKVGVWGISYPGFYTTTALLSRHPALVAASPQAPIADLWRDDGWHNGAFFLVANFGFYPGFTNRQDDKPTQRRGGRFDPGTEDGYDFFMKMGPMKNTNDKYYKDTIRLWNEMMDHPDYDDHWKARNVLYHLHDIKTAVLVTGGWYDAEDLYGAINTYKTLVKNNPHTPIYFTMGPWVHGGWARGAGDHLGDIDFGGPTGPHYRNDIEFNFFSHYLKETPLALAPVNTFETGTNTWKTYNVWPPAPFTEKNLYLLPGGKLSFSAPDKKGKDSYDEYVSDPANPVPFIADRNQTMDMQREYMTADQRFLAGRKDVLSYQTDVLDHDVTIAGNIWANLHVSTTGTDADFVVKVLDVYPDTASNNKFTGKDVKMAGYQQMVRSEPIRGKYRNNISKPEPFVPGKVTEVKWELQDVLHTFKKGHRIMVQVQSTWFPLIDRNPQQFLDIMKAKDSDFVKATERVYTSGANPSFIKVRVL